MRNDPGFESEERLEGSVSLGLFQVLLLLCNLQPYLVLVMGAITMGATPHLLEHLCIKEELVGEEGALVLLLQPLDHGHQLGQLFSLLVPGGLVVEGTVPLPALLDQAPQPEIVCVCHVFVQGSARQVLLVGEEDDHVSLSSCPKDLLHPGHGHHILLGEAPQLGHQPQHVGPWHQQQITGSDILIYFLILAPGLEDGGRVHHQDALPIPRACCPLILPGHRLGPELGLKCGLAEDAVPGSTFPTACFAYQDDPQGGGVFKALMFYLAYKKKKRKEKKISGFTKFVILF